VLDKPYDPAKFSAGFHTSCSSARMRTVIQFGGFFDATPGHLPHLYVTLKRPDRQRERAAVQVGGIPTLMA